ncbi:hypothetical protein RRF57_001136 [Xylaria bambusicola]|uniref:Uncharacterized protein n=1 Tax=Xylaria bambusicola TaxID=326684 RepID=A0AAN7U521_9PEZI
MTTEGVHLSDDVVLTAQYSSWATSHEKPFPHIRMHRDSKLRTWLENDDLRSKSEFWRRNIIGRAKALVYQAKELAIYT